MSLKPEHKGRVFWGGVVALSFLALGLSMLSKSHHSLLIIIGCLLADCAIGIIRTEFSRRPRDTESERTQRGLSLGILQKILFLAFVVLAIFLIVYALTMLPVGSDPIVLILFLGALATILLFFLWCLSKRTW